MPMIEFSENVLKKELIELIKILERNSKAKEAYVEAIGYELTIRPKK